VKKFIQTVKNIWSIDELRNKITITLLLVLVYRFGAHVALPGIDPNKLDLESAKSGLLGLFDTFAGGSFSNASIFALGIMPYISASIFMQLMTILVPQMQKVQQEKDQPMDPLSHGYCYVVPGSSICCLPEECKP
jgi:preprotein translocase subunit SecY